MPDRENVGSLQRDLHRGPVFYRQKRCWVNARVRHETLSDQESETQDAMLRERGEPLAARTPALPTGLEGTDGGERVAGNRWWVIPRSSAVPRRSCATRAPRVAPTCESDTSRCFEQGSQTRMAFWE